MDEFLESIDEKMGFRAGPLVLGGFSQGGTTSLAFAISRPGRVDGVVVLSGFLATGRAACRESGRSGDTPVFWAHGTQDPAVPFSLAVDGWRRLNEAGIAAGNQGLPHGPLGDPGRDGGSKGLVGGHCSRLESSSLAP